MSSKRLKIVLPVAVVIVAVVVSVILVHARSPVEKAEISREVPLVRVIEVAPVDVHLNVYSQGTVEPSRKTEIVSQVSGRITSVGPGFADGGYLGEGETLVQLDPRDHQVAVAQAEAALAQSRTRLAREEAEAQVAREEWQELGQGEPSSLVLRQPQVAEARSAVEASEAAVMQARLNLARTTIRAPFTGRILAKRADLGQFVSPGVPIATMYATDYAEVDLPVTSEELGLIELDRIGTADAPRVNLSADFAGTRRRWEGRLVRTGGAIDSASRMLELTARVDRPFEPSAEGSFPLQIGLFVEAEIEGRIANEVFILPRSSVRRDGRVLIVDRENRIRFRDVGVIRKTETEAVIGSGLAKGDIVVLSPLETPVEGMTVSITANNASSSSGTEIREVQP